MDQARQDFVGLGAEVEIGDRRVDLRVGDHGFDLVAQPDPDIDARDAQRLAELGECRVRILDLRAQEIPERTDDVAEHGDEPGQRDLRGAHLAEQSVIAVARGDDLEFEAGRQRQRDTPQAGVEGDRTRGRDLGCGE